MAALPALRFLLRSSSVAAPTPMRSRGHSLATALPVTSQVVHPTTQHTQCRLASAHSLCQTRMVTAGMEACGRQQAVRMGASASRAALLALQAFGQGLHRHQRPFRHRLLHLLRLLRLLLYYPLRHLSRHALRHPGRLPLLSHHGLPATHLHLRRHRRPRRHDTHATMPTSGAQALAPPSTPG